MRLSNSHSNCEKNATEKEIYEWDDGFCNQLEKLFNSQEVVYDEDGYPIVEEDNAEEYYYC